MWWQMIVTLAGLGVLGGVVLGLDRRARRSPLPWEQPSCTRRPQRAGQGARSCGPQTVTHEPDPSR
jgi:hypothetical protein